MMENNSFIRRHIKLLISLVLLLLAFFIVSSYGVVVTSLGSTPGGEKATITIGAGKNKKEFNLSPGEKKISLVKRSQNQIKATSSDAYTGAVFSLGLFGYKNLELNVEPQKASEAIGLSDGSCAVDNSKSVTFYRCNENGNFVNATVDGVSYFDNTDESLNPSQTVIKPYLSGYLSFTKEGDGLGIKGYAFENNSYKPLGSASLNFSGQISPTNIAVDTSSAKSSKFAVFDEKKYVLTIFKDASGKNLLTLDLREKLGKYKDNKTMVYMAGESLVLFNGAEVFVDEGELLASSEDEQRLLYVDLTSGRVVKEQLIDSELRVASIANGTSGKVVFYAYSGSPDKKDLYISDGEDIQKISVAGTVGQVVCWKNNKTFYLTLNDKEVVVYSPEDKIYRLVYDSKDKSIFGMSCFGGNVYLSHGPKNLSAADPRLESIKILDEDLSGTRLETLLPIGPGSIIDIDSAFSFRNEIHVNLLNTDVLDFSRNPNDRPLPKPRDPKKHQNNAIDFFKEQGVDTSKYKFIFSY